MPPYEPSAEQRRLVRTMAGFGVPQEDIARHLGVDPKTLRRHFRDELDTGTTDANLRVAQSLFQMATTGKNVAAAIFWMKARAGWREKHAIDVTTRSVQQLSDADLHRVIELYQEAGEADDLTATLTDTELLAIG
jgi:AraC-like DNA-binding protein